MVGCGGSGRGIASALARAGAAVTLVDIACRAGLGVAARKLPLVPLSQFSARRCNLIVNATPVGREDDAVPFHVEG